MFSLGRQDSFPPFPAMPARQVVLLTPLESPHPKALLSSQQPAPISPLAATLMDSPASVANKRLTVELSPLDATLTKNTGGGDILLLRNSSLTTRHGTQVLSLAGACEPAWPHPLYLLPFQLSTVDCQLPVQSLRLRPGEE